MLAIVACSHAWTWPPTDKTHPQLNWRQPVPVTPEQEGFVHPVLPPEPPADDPPIDCRVPTDRARDFKPNFLRALIQLFTGIVAWSLSDSLKGTTAAAAAQAMRGAGRRAIQMLAGSGAAVAAPATRLLDASLRRLDGRAPAPAAVAAPPPQPANATAITVARSPPSLSLAASAATATPMFGPRKAMAVELWFFAVFEIAAAVANYGAVYVHAAQFGRAIRRNSARIFHPRNSPTPSPCHRFRYARIKGGSGTSTYRGEKVQSAASAEFTELWGQAGSAAETLELIAWTWLELATFEITGIDYSDLFKLVLLIGMYTLNMPRLFAPLHMSFATLFVYGMLLFGSLDSARAAQFAILAHIVVLMFLRFQARRAHTHAYPRRHPAPRPPPPPTLVHSPSQGGRLPWAIPKAVDDIIGLLPYAFLLLVVPSAWASGLVDGSALPIFAFLIAAAFALYSPVLEPQLRPKYDALQKVRAPTAQAPAAPRRSAAHPPPPHAPHTPRA